VIDLTAVLLAVIAAVPPTIIALASYRSSVKVKREVAVQAKKVKDVEQVSNRNANKIDSMHAETQRFMQTVAVTTAEFKAAQAKRRASGFGELDP
jgi:hypothetical protein